MAEQYKHIHQSQNASLRRVAGAFRTTSTDAYSSRWRSHQLAMCSTMQTIRQHHGTTRSTRLISLPASATRTTRKVNSNSPEGPQRHRTIHPFRLVALGPAHAWLENQGGRRCEGGRQEGCRPCSPGKSSGMKAECGSCGSVH